mmetsp:Transcript_38931/g.98143  ORF Transcript_38931/g.98143 Transcript_38931/m.98143 type:complete len:550 (-) Transcript_38931:66-1715(-)|eukprot:CAMPEP_0174242396 /NCGR_PEP_ID=MMETSP0417-20130205/27746_1 /TAXON_ID=242541 /ORGANISM="Mayorella sp, Strain BSH-02190019" /LENGTH=549 /DNA_ID=CAMNT_0015321783 /DNA_START=65 /DNA_END=1714 /DNA_ORIENTATION=-
MDEDTACKTLLAGILTTRKARAGHVVLYAQLAGSWAFHLNVPESDKDYFGIYIGDLDHVLSCVSQPESTLDHHDPDYAVYELRHYSKILLKGNPKVIEPLFTTHLCYEHELWNSLKLHRSKLLTREVFSQYMSYAKSQLIDQDAGKGNPTKKYYHAMRLLGEAERILNGDSPKVWLDGAERELIMSIRLGKVSLEDCQRAVQEIEQRVAARQEEKLLRLPTRESGEAASTVDRWMISCYRSLLLDRQPSTSSLAVDLSLSDAAEDPLHRATLACASELLGGVGLAEARVLACVRMDPVAAGLDVTLERGPSWLCVFVVPTDRFLSIAQPLPVLVGESDTQPQFASDRPRLDRLPDGVTLVELSYFLEQLKSASPHAYVALSARTHLLSTSWWRTLCKHACELEQPAIFNQCVGKASGLLKRSTINELSEEPGSRSLLFDATELLCRAEHFIDGSPVCVDWNHQPEHKLLLEQVARAESDLASWRSSCETQLSALIEWRKSKPGKARLGRSKAAQSANATRWEEIDRLVVGLRKHLFVCGAHLEEHKSEK